MAFTAPLRQATAIRRGQCILWRIGGGGDNTAGGTGPRTPNRVVNSALVQQQFLLQQQRGRRLISNCAVRFTTNKNNNNAAAGTQLQSQSPLGAVGVEAALAAAASSSSGTGHSQSQQGEVQPTIWDEFALKDRVALVSGANRGLGLEMALVLIEAGARAVYCVDLPAQPGSDWVAVSEYVKRMVGTDGAKGGRLEYVSADVRDQTAMWKIGEEIGNREGRMDVCVAAAGILKAHTDCLEYPGEEFEEVRLFFSFLRWRFSWVDPHFFLN
jgi:short chain dehydrogenase